MNKAFSNKRSIALFMTPAALVFLAVMIIPILRLAITVRWNGTESGTLRLWE